MINILDDKNFNALSLASDIEKQLLKDTNPLIIEDMKEDFLYLIRNNAWQSKQVPKWFLEVVAPARETYSETHQMLVTQAVLQGVVAFLIRS